MATAFSGREPVGMIRDLIKANDKSSLLSALSSPAKYAEAVNASSTAWLRGDNASRGKPPSAKTLLHSHFAISLRERLLCLFALFFLFFCYGVGKCRAAMKLLDKLPVHF